MTIDEALLELNAAADLPPFQRLTEWQVTLNAYAASVAVMLCSRNHDDGLEL
jgi:hypothetical protein